MRSLLVVTAGLLSFWALAAFGVFAQETAAQQRAGDGPMASRATVLPTADPALEVLESRSEARVMGRYGGEGPAVSFGAWAEVPGATASATRVLAERRGGDDEAVLPATTARVAVAGKSFSWTDNPARGTAVLDGPGKSLTGAEARSLDGAADGLWRALLRDRPKEEWTSEEMWLANTLAYLAEAPPGLRIGDSSEDVAAETSEASETAGGPGLREADLSSAAATRADDLPAELDVGDMMACREDALAAGQFVSLAACYRGDEDGLYRLTCETKNRNESHDAEGGSGGDHCFRTRLVYSGPCSGGCLGQCGADCYGRGTFGGYYQDCIDHDRCSQHHDASGGPFDDHCGDEYREADDDFVRALNNYRKYGPNCGNCPSSLERS